MDDYLNQIEDDEDRGEDWLITTMPPPPPPATSKEPELTYSLAREIGALRRLLDRLEAEIAAEAEPERLVLPLTRLVEAIARTLRIHSGIVAGPDEELQAAIDQVFKNLGWDAEH